MKTAVLPRERLLIMIQNEYSTLPSPQSFRAIEQMLIPVTVPIFIKLNGKVGTHATALLFACGDYHFLVTARHAVTDADKYGANLLIPSDSTPGKLVAIPSKYLMCSDTRIDVAILQITEEYKHHFQDHNWTRLADFAASYPTPGIFCACFGILASESEVWSVDERNPTARLQEFVFLNSIVELDEFPAEWIPAIHFAAQANITGTADHTGAASPSPSSFGGLSGGPVALFHQNPWLHNFSPLPLRIGGFQSSVITFNDAKKRQVTKIVHWRAMFELIATAYPTVRDIGKNYGIT